MTDYAVRWRQAAGVSYFNGNGSNGLVISGSARTVTATSASAGVATITTSVDHGYQKGQVVDIAGVAPAGYNGTYVIRSVPTTTTFTILCAATGSLTTQGTVTPQTKFLVDSNNSTETPINSTKYVYQVAVVSLGVVGTWTDPADVRSEVTPFADGTLAPSGTVTTSSTQTSTAGDSVARGTTTGGWQGIVVTTANASWNTMTLTYSLFGVSKSITVTKVNTKDKTTVYFTVPPSVALSLVIYKPGTGQDVSFTISAV